MIEDFVTRSLLTELTHLGVFVRCGDESGEQ